MKDKDRELAIKKNHSTTSEALLYVTLYLFTISDLLTCVQHGFEVESI